VMSAIRDNNSISLHIPAIFLFTSPTVKKERGIIYNFIIGSQDPSAGLCTFFNRLIYLAVDMKNEGPVKCSNTSTVMKKLCITC
jgi:hypothetical protein